MGLLLLIVIVAGRLTGGQAPPLRVTLSGAIAQALEGNPDAAIASHRIAMAEAALTQARSAFWPRLRISSSYHRTDNPIGVFGAALNQESFSPTLNFNDVPDADNLNLKGLVTAPIYQGGRVRAGRDAARAQAGVATQTAEAIRHQLAHQTTVTFHTLVKLRAILEAAEAGEAAFAANLTNAYRRFRAGTSLKTDVLDLEVQFARAREQTLRTRNAIKLSRHVLRNLLGIEGGEVEIVEPAVYPSPPAADTDAQRPELLAVRKQIQAAEADVRAARSGHRPSVSAFTSLDHDRGWRFNGSGESYTAGLMVEWNLWDGRQTRGKVAEARAQLAATLESERRLRLAIDLETRQARLNLETADERLKVTGKAIDQARESAGLIRNRFEQGLALASQVIDAETALIAARTHDAEAGADHRIAVAALRKALGLPQTDSPDQP